MPRFPVFCTLCGTKLRPFTVKRDWQFRKAHRECWKRAGACVAAIRYDPFTGAALGRDERPAKRTKPSPEFAGATGDRRKTEQQLLRAFVASLGGRAVLLLPSLLG